MAFAKPATQIPWIVGLFHLLFLLLVHLSKPAASATTNFTFNGFLKSDLILDGSASVTSAGALCLTNASGIPKYGGSKGHAFYPVAIELKNRSSAKRTLSFSTCFVFSIVSQGKNPGGHGLAFTLSPSMEFSHSMDGDYLGLFNSSNDGNSSNHVFAVELDTVRSSFLSDIDGNHVGVDINSVVSSVSETAAYFGENNEKQPVDLLSGNPLQAWIDYDGHGKQLNITLAPLSSQSLKPKHPLVSYAIDLSSVLSTSTYAGFSAATGEPASESEHYIWAWSFKIGGQAPSFNLSQIPQIPNNGSKSKSKSSSSKLVPYSSTLAVFLAMGSLFIACRTYRNWKLTAENLEDWELEYPHRVPYKEIYNATKGFKNDVLGKGGFGNVYRAVLPSIKGMEVAIKKVSHGSKQGMREFVAEITSLGKLRHRNLVQLQGWCRRQEELILVYEFMPNGSLDSFLFEDKKRNLSWDERFGILKGVASGLFYLHEGWEQVVVHRDVKASNVLLDHDMIPKLSDFGLARLYEHGTNPKTTHVVGTFGYMAPELVNTWKASTTSDVFAFGALLLEVACGRRPVEPDLSDGEDVLVEWVHMLWRNGQILFAIDKRLGVNYDTAEAELVLKLGVLCSQANPQARPSVRQVIQILDGDTSLKELDFDSLVLEDHQGFDQLILPFPSPEKMFSDSSSHFETNETT